MNSSISLHANAPSPRNFPLSFHPETRTILVVNDSELDRTFISEVLRTQRYKIIPAATGEEGLEKLEQGIPDLVCLDVRLPGIDGFEVCRRIRANSTLSHIPILMVSGYFMEESHVVEGLEAGANDYVRVPFAVQEFLGRTQALIRTKIMEDRLRTLALEDCLTHLGNRRLFLDQLEGEMARAARHATELSLVLLDIDRFKSINDTYGHPMGDEVLQGIATLLHENIRKEDGAFRWGGDEFALLLVEMPLNKALEKARNLQVLIATTDFSLSSRNICTTASQGVGIYRPEVHDKLEDFVYSVDKALYEAKRAGGNTIRATESG